MNVHGLKMKVKGLNYMIGVLEDRRDGLSKFSSDKGRIEREIGSLFRVKQKWLGRLSDKRRTRKK